MFGGRPSPPESPKTPPPPPDEDSDAKAEAEEKAKKEEELAKRRRGRSATILTSGLGVQDDESTLAKKSLIGGKE
jgi:hypothetical protein